MEATLRILNDLEAAGLIERYAIGGAMAAFFYSEAVLTEDLDAFVVLSQPAGSLVTLTPIYDFLKQRGASEEREHLWLAGTLLQIIPAYDHLSDEAVREAVEKQIGQTTTRVMRVEHLLALALKTGRKKDHARIALLLKEAAVDSDRLADILQRHGLSDQWKRLNLPAE